MTANGDASGAKLIPRRGEAAWEDQSLMKLPFH